jgi:hypothetical protein
MASNTIAQFALDFSRKESVVVVYGQRAWPACSSPPPAPRGLRGFWVEKRVASKKVRWKKEATKFFDVALGFYSAELELIH